MLEQFSTNTTKEKSMNYTKDTQLNTIANAQTIAKRTISDIENMLKSFTLGAFIEENKKTGDLELKTQSLSTICGASAGAIANQIKARKGDIFAKLGDFFATWTKNGNNAANQIANAVKNEKIQMAKNMLSAEMKPEQIATITGLTIDEINALNA